MQCVPIDKRFFETYFSPDLPDTKAGDLILLAMERVGGARLIVQDIDLHQEAKALGVEAYRIKEFLDRFIGD